MSSGGNLPQDIKDIVSRLPVKSLHRFKCTSFSWKSQISDPQFAKTHLNRTKIKNSKYAEQKIIIISGCGNLYSMDPNDLVSRSDKSIFLLNPSTRECTKLPICPFVQRDYWNNCVLLDKYGVGYDSTTDDYKVLWMLSYFDEEGVIDDFAIVAVYSLKTNAWRRVEDFQSRCVEGNSGGRSAAPGFSFYPIFDLQNFDTYGIKLRKRKKEGFRHIPMFVVRRAVY
ncbi:F-box protein CPR1-like [Rhododendron vialii]|uniref:F-box protein CPR1-like n=1 Tax=Rhododendron vialii TaxID=182163 RepID=UPI00265F82D6|nr:F-box protein CPR1-like [Rhododendron vialii]